MANPEEERRRESFKAYLEMYKHMSTLSTAAAVLLVALHKDVGVEGYTTVVTLVLLGISLFCSVTGIADAASQIGLGPEDPDRREDPKGGFRGRFASYGSGWFFLFGLLSYAITALGLV